MRPFAIGGQAAYSAPSILNSGMQLDLVAFGIVKNQPLERAVVVLESLHVSTCRLQAFQRFFNHWSLEYHVEPALPQQPDLRVLPRGALLLDQIHTIARDDHPAALGIRTLKGI